MTASARTTPAAPAWLDRIPGLVGVLLLGTAAVVLIGWAFEAPLLLRWVPGMPQMRANAAVSFGLTGLALLGIRAGGRGRTVASAAAAAVLLIAVATVYEYASGADLGIDQLLFRDRLARPGEAPGRMAFLAAVGFVLVGTHLLLLSRSAPPVINLIAYAIGIAGVPGLLEHAYDLEAVQPVRVPGPSIGLNTAVMMVILGFTLAVASPGSPLKRLLASRGAGGVMVRRLLPLAVIIPFITGSALLRAHEAGHISLIGVVAMFAAANIVVLGAGVLWTAIAIERAEFLRSRLAAMVESSSDSIIGTDLAGTVTYWNAGAEALYGYMSAEAIGRPVTIIAPPAAHHEAMSLVARVAAGEVIASHESTRVRKDGTPVDVSLALSPIRDVSGTVIGISAIGRDVSERRRLEAAARQAESRFRALVEQAMVGVYSMADGRFVYVNRKMADIFGYTPEEMLAMPSVMQIVDPTDRERVTEQIRVRLTTGRSVHYQALGRRKDGSRLYADIHGGVLGDGTGHLIGMLHDDTERRAAQDALAESEARLKEAQAVAHVGSWELDLRSGVLLWSDEVYRIFGVEPRAFGATYEYFLERIHPDDRELVNQAYSTSVETRTPYSIDHRLVLADGTVKFVHERCATCYDEQGHALRSVGTVQDITDRKLAQEALRRLNDELESRVEKRTAELQAANKELEAFSYSVSHDLRAPLRALQGFSRLLLEEHVSDLSPEAVHFVTIIHDNAAQMGVLIDDLLTFSRLTRLPVRTETVDMRSLTLQTLRALQQLEPDEDGRTVDVRVDDLPACAGDSALLRQVLLNLLSNARKFTRHREQAVIEIGTASGLAGPDEHVYFVKDNGAGFDMKYAGKLFGIFQRLHSAAEYEGTGVGLAIVQRIVHRHGGRVWPEAAPDGGATFYFSLPKDVDHGTDGR